MNPVFLQIAWCAAGIAALSAANFAANHLFVRHTRLAYTLAVVFLAGTVVPAFALKALTSAAWLAAAAFAPAPLALALAAVIGAAFLALSVRRDPAEQRARIPALAIALFAPSLAEVLVFVGLVFTATDHLLAPVAGPLAAKAAAIALTSASFGLYHLTHAAPWNSLRMVRILFVVWLFIGLFYALTGSLWATALFNTLLAVVGFVKNRVTRPQDLPLAANLALDALGIAAVLGILCGF